MKIKDINDGVPIFLGKDETGRYPADVPVGQHYNEEEYPVTTVFAIDPDRGFNNGDRGQVRLTFKIPLCNFN